jgi:hypothetical protein
MKDPSEQSRMTKNFVTPIATGICLKILNPLEFLTMVHKCLPAVSAFITWGSTKLYRIVADVPFKGKSISVNYRFCSQQLFSREGKAKKFYGFI